MNVRNWTLTSEPALNRGDVQIEAGESSVNYLMEDRIRNVLQSFCGMNRHQVVGLDALSERLHIINSGISCRPIFSGS